MKTSTLWAILRGRLGGLSMKMLTAVLALMAYCLTVYFAFQQFGLFWALIALTPANVLIMWFVGTWPIALLGFGLFTFLNSRDNH